MKVFKMFAVLFAVFMVFSSLAWAEDYTDPIDGEDVASFAETRFDGPFVIDKIDRTGSSTLKAYFTNGQTYTSTIGKRQRALGLALVDNNSFFLFIDGSSVTGIVLVADK